MAKKVDNDNLEAKLLLRRYFLDRYHSGGANVLDCCQGDGVIWSILREEREVASYWGVDVKPKKGRIKIDSSRILEGNWTADFVDVDTYGSPWKHWLNILKTIDHPTTVILTYAARKSGGGPAGFGVNGTPDKVTMAAIGATIPIPKALASKLGPFAFGQMLGMASEMCLVVEAKEVQCKAMARYLGFRMEPKPLASP